MKTISVVLVAAILAFGSLVVAAKDGQTITEDEYRASVLVLFEEFLRMEEDGVFLDDETIKLFGPNYEFPNTTRGDHPPGGYFGRPPGSDWLDRVQRLRDTGHKFVCFDIPAMPSGAGICGYDLLSLMSIASPGEMSFTDAMAARFWLATICYRNPAACEPYL